MRLWHKEEEHVVIVTLSLQLRLRSNHLQVTDAGRLRGAAARFDRWNLHVFSALGSLDVGPRVRIFLNIKQKYGRHC